MLDKQRLIPRSRHDLIRLGLRRDGGYVVPAAAVERTAVLLSLGIGRDWSFEKAFRAANRAVRVIGVDPSVDPRYFAQRLMKGVVGLIASGGFNRRKRKHHGAMLRNAIDYFWFFALRHRHITVSVGNSEDPEHVTIGSLVTLAAETDHRIFLKMDIEGSEYGIVPDIARHHGSINCVVAEFHRVGQRAALFNEAVATLQRHFDIVHLHGNNYRPYDASHDFPDTVEMTLVNRALMADPIVASTCEYPRAGLDFPNNPSLPDYQLRFG
jgi:hypothetical protein